MNGQTKMCPPLNYSSSIEGKYSLGINWVEVRVSKCGSLYNNSIPCANQTQVDNLINTWGELFADFFFIKPIINPGNTDYLDYQLDDSTFVSFTKTLGAHVNALINEYTIETD